MRKRTTAILLTAAMTASMLAGCGGSQGDGSKEASGSGGKKGDSDTLTVMCVGTEADTYIDAYNSIAEKFSEDNEFGVKVKIDFYENEQYKTKLTTLMASNAVPDVFFTWELSYLQPFVEGGKVTDITSYLEKDAEWKDSFADGTLELLSYDGKNYESLPRNHYVLCFITKRYLRKTEFRCLLHMMSF